MELLAWTFGTWEMTLLAGVRGEVRGSSDAVDMNQYPGCFVSEGGPRSKWSDHCRTKWERADNLQPSSVYERWTEEAHYKKQSWRVSGLHRTLGRRHCV